MRPELVGDIIDSKHARLTREGTNHGDINSPSRSEGGRAWAVNKTRRTVMVVSQYLDAGRFGDDVARHLERASSSRMGQNILFVISDAMVKENATSTAARAVHHCEIWPSMFIAVAKRLAEKGHQCHFVVSTFNERGASVKRELERASLSVTAIKPSGSLCDGLLSSISGTKRDNAAADGSSLIGDNHKISSADAGAGDIEMGLKADVPKTGEERRVMSSFFEDNFIDEAMRLLMTCEDFRPTLIISGENALHLIVPAGLKYNAPLLLMETNGPLLSSTSKYKRTSPKLRRCHNVVTFHQKAKQKKQLELANSLVQCLSLRKPFTLNEWKGILYCIKKMYLTSELNFQIPIDDNSPLGSLKSLKCSPESCFDFMFCSVEKARKLRQNTKQQRGAVVEEDTSDESAIVPAELESPDNSHRLSGDLSGFSLEQFLTYGAPVIGVWIDVEDVAKQLRARTPHQRNRCVREMGQLIFGALADLRLKGLILHYSPDADNTASTSEEPFSSQLRTNLLDDSLSESHADVVEFAKEHIKEVAVRSPEEAIKVLGRCKAIIHNGAMNHTIAVSHLGIPSVVIPKSYFASKLVDDFKTSQLALQEHHLAQTMQSLGTATVTSAFGTLSRPVLVNHVRSALEESMNLQSVDLSCQLEAEDSLGDAVESVEDTVKTFCDSPEEEGDCNTNLDCVLDRLSILSCDDLQREGVESNTKRYTKHVYNIPYILRLEWTAQEGEDKYRFSSLKGHGQLA